MYTFWWFVWNDLFPLAMLYASYLGCFVLQFLFFQLLFALLWITLDLFFLYRCYLFNCSLSVYIFFFASLSLDLAHRMCLAVCLRMYIDIWIIALAEMAKDDIENLFMWQQTLRQNEIIKPFPHRLSIHFSGFRRDLSCCLLTLIISTFLPKNFCADSARNLYGTDGIAVHLKCSQWDERTWIDG